MITRDNIEYFFENMRDQRDQELINFDIDNDCIWAFIFIDNDIDRLISIAKYLAQYKFNLVGFIEPEPEDTDQETIYMRIDKTETHSVDTIVERNKYFHNLAEEYGILGYNGMDVYEIPSDTGDEPN